MAFTDTIVLDDLERKLFDAMSKMPVIDAHEHLRTEKEFVATECDGAWTMQYVSNDLQSAGLDAAFNIYDNSFAPARSGMSDVSELHHASASRMRMRSRGAGDA